MSRRDAAVGLGAAPPPGRYQRVDSGQPFQVVVDFAHTPPALTQLIATARRASRNRVHLVVGGAGNRDRFNRPDMGRVALTADSAIFTADDPHDEAPEEIIAQMLTGTIGRAGAAIVVERDRRKAITAAVERAEPGDVVLIAGRGHERYQTVEGIQHPFSDVAVAEAALADKGWSRRPAASLPNSAAPTGVPRTRSAHPGWRRSGQSRGERR